MRGTTRTKLENRMTTNVMKRMSTMIVIVRSDGDVLNEDNDRELVEVS